MLAPETMQAFFRYLQTRQREMLHLLRRFVTCESPSDNKLVVDRLARIVGAEWRRRGTRIECIRQHSAGDHLRIAWPPSKAAGKKQILVLGHLDTVYPIGTLRRTPFRVSRGRAFGPGVFDMKGGIVIALAAVDALSRCKRPPQSPVTFLFTSDEETGSASSRALIEREARRSSAVLVLEPAEGTQGRLKTRRKGIGAVEIVIRGRAAHAGLHPEEGVNALHEMSLQVARLARMANARIGTTVSPTVAEAGSRSNVIPANARLVVDLRAGTKEEIRKLERKLRALRPILRGAEIEVRGGFSRPPLEHEASAALFAAAKRIAAMIGVELGECSVGGGSDGNFTAALGIPTLDGLGAVGDGAHSDHENVIVRALPQRAAILAGLLAEL